MRQAAANPSAEWRVAATNLAKPRLPGLLMASCESCTFAPVTAVSRNSGAQEYVLAVCVKSGVREKWGWGSGVSAAYIGSALDLD
ncbi:hypothetical protein GCM10007053_25460 [Halioglobus pacificus]|uniref:Uncharacterized protein n=1 Tax=Parahalioglobus pacificus TaxID=930806 RepID=A0A919CMT0_9GAMM|nr:hypothetical protein GCM10007053_25460 [Halioglobus pacificus]